MSTDQWFDILARALSTSRLPVSAGPFTSYRVATAGEFMLMSSPDLMGVAHFKHIGSRNYLICYVDGRLVVPASGRPFERGEFPA